MKAISIIDEPCGTGKTSQMISSLSPAKNYLIVVPYLSEVQRIIRDAKQMNLFQPEAKFASDRSKQSHLRQLLKDKNPFLPRTHFTRMQSRLHERGFCTITI